MPRLTLAAIARDVGVTRQAVEKHASKQWFPPRGEDGLWEGDDVKAALKKHLRARSKPSKVTSSAELAAEAKRPEITPGHPSVARLMSGNASAEEISEALVQVAAVAVAQAVIDKSISKNEIDALKNALQEARGAAAAYLEIGERKKNLIERSVAESIVAEISTRLVRCMDNLINSTSMEMGVWMGDSAMLAMPAGQRATRVRDYMTKACRDVRVIEAQELRGIIEQIDGTP